jgi:hypothetical protein
LIETHPPHRARAERKVERELLDDLKRITDKQNLLFGLADITLAQLSRTGLCAMRSFRWLVLL